MTNLDKITKQARERPGQWVYVTDTVKCIVRHGKGRRVRWYLKGSLASREKCALAISQDPPQRDLFQ